MSCGSVITGYTTTYFISVLSNACHESKGLLEVVEQVLLADGIASALHLAQVHTTRTHTYPPRQHNTAHGSMHAQHSKCHSMTARTMLHSLRSGRSVLRSSSVSNVGLEAKHRATTGRTATPLATHAKGATIRDTAYIVETIRMEHAQTQSRDVRPHGRRLHFISRILDFVYQMFAKLFMARAAAAGSQSPVAIAAMQHLDELPKSDSATDASRHAEGVVPGTGGESHHSAAMSDSPNSRRALVPLQVTSGDPHPAQQASTPAQLTVRCVWAPHGVVCV